MNLSKNKISEPVILIVDDNLDNLKLLSDMLRKNGYKTRRAISGSLALQALTATDFDLILLDITMPEMNGYEVCQKIKANPNFAHIPIIFISALNDVLDKVKAFSIGGVDYITKPFQMEEITARVANQMRIITLQKELQQLNQELIQKNQKLQIEQRDIKNSQARIVQNSLKDPITNLDTKIAFMGKLRQVIKTALEKDNYNYALIIIKDDQFKLEKSILTIELEKKFLMIASKELIDAVPDCSIVGYLDETEFGVLINNLTKPEDIIKTVQHLHKKFKLSFALEEQEFFFNPNYGIVLGNKSYQFPEQLLYDARNAFSYAVIKGYGQAHIFNQEIKQKTLKNIQLKSNFKQALKKQNFTINYQPIINLNTEKISGYRTDIIWKESEHKVITLEVLTQIATKISLLPEFNYLYISNIGDRIRELQEVFLWQNGLEKDFDPNFKTIIGLSSEQLLQGDFVKQIKLILQKYHVEGEHIILELPLKFLVDKYDLILRNITQIRELSINLSVDNIGTDYVNFIRQNSLSINHLTINYSLIEKITEKEEERRIYQNFIAIAHDLGMSVTATGVTNAQQLEILQQYGCEFATGSYITQLVQPKLQLINQVVF